MTAKSKVRGAEAELQGPQPKAQRLRPTAVDHLASLLCAWLALALLVDWFESLPRQFQARVPAA